MKVFNLASLADVIEDHGPVVRIVITEAHGSTPRDAGTSMLVWRQGFSGTIGGGRLEFEAIEAARNMLSAPEGPARESRRIPLGPSLGQCCGGAVTLLSEVCFKADITILSGLDGAFARPLAADGLLRTDRFRQPDPPLWIYGAGHVGREIVDVLAGSGFSITWVDTAADRFPQAVPDHATKLVAADPSRIVAYAPLGAMHLVLTYCHKMDLAICHAALSRQPRFLGLIGSDTKRARFRRRLSALGHPPERIEALTCPIGDKSLGKTPRAIALGVARQLLSEAEPANNPARLQEEALT